MLWPSVGVSTGTWGTGTNVGVGVGVGGNGPGPASTDRDRRVMETELEDRGFRTACGQTGRRLPVFPGRRDEGRPAIELVYQHDGGEVKLPLELAEKEIAY